MLELLNNILTSYALPGLILCFGLSFFFVVVPEREGLRGYRMARKMMGCSYLIYFAALVARAVTQSTPTPFLQQLITITIGCMQALFFTFALITLIDVKFFTRHRILRDLTILILVATVAISVTLLNPAYLGMPTFIIFTLFYLGQLVSYVIRFFQRYHNYEQRMADYYSDDDRLRLKWVKRSFFTALIIGILALFFAIFPSTETSLLFTLLTLIYYTIFGIRFINYAFYFQQIEPAMMEPPLEEQANNAKQEDLVPSDSIAEPQLMEHLNALMKEQRLYTQHDLTIEHVAVQVNASIRTVSLAIHNCENTNFKSWVNTYRVEDAKQLIADGFLDTHTTDALATAVGFSNRTNFYRVFKKFTGDVPKGKDSSNG